MSAQPAGPECAIRSGAGRHQRTRQFLSAQSRQESGFAWPPCLRLLFAGQGLQRPAADHWSINSRPLLRQAGPAARQCSGGLNLK